jgi:hypothetical protein
MPIQFEVLPQKSNNIEENEKKPDSGKWRMNRKWAEYGRNLLNDMRNVYPDDTEELSAPIPVPYWQSGVNPQGSRQTHSMFIVLNFENKCLPSPLPWILIWIHALRKKGYKKVAIAMFSTIVFYVGYRINNFPFGQSLVPLVFLSGSFFSSFFVKMCRNIELRIKEILCIILYLNNLLNTYYV